MDDDILLQRINITIDEFTSLAGDLSRIVHQSMESHYDSLQKQGDMFRQLVEQNNALLSSSDGRLDRANKMVLELTEAINAISKTIESNNSTVAHLEKTYTSRIDQLLENYRNLMSSYQKLLHRYEDKEKELAEKNKEIIDVLARLADKTTVANNTYT